MGAPPHGPPGPWDAMIKILEGVVRQLPGDPFVVPAGIRVRSDPDGRRMTRAPAGPMWRIRARQIDFTA